MHMLEFLLTLTDESDRSKLTEIYQEYHEIMYKAALRHPRTMPLTSGHAKCRTDFSHISSFLSPFITVRAH